VTENPVKLTRSVRETLTHVTSGGAQVYIWPGGGITYMVDVMEMPENSFGYVPTPALVAPIEFTMRLADYAALGGHMGSVRRSRTWRAARPGVQRLARGTDAARWPVQPHRFGWGRA
jgi:6-hydroxynicotinate reductase